MASVIPVDSLEVSPTASLFEGGDEIGASIFVTEYPERGDGPALHWHPYPEVFVVQDGTAVFTAGDEELTVPAGNIVIVPAHTNHGFKSAADETLRVVSVHPRGKIEQTWV